MSVGVGRAADPPCITWVRPWLSIKHFLKLKSIKCSQRAPLHWTDFHTKRRTNSVFLSREPEPPPRSGPDWLYLIQSSYIKTNKDSIHGISCHWNNIEILNSRQNIVNADSCMCSPPRNPKSLHFKVNFCFILASLLTSQTQPSWYISSNIPSKWLFINQKVLHPSSPLCLSLSVYLAGKSSSSLLLGIIRVDQNEINLRQNYFKFYFRLQRI